MPGKATAGARGASIGPVMSLLPATHEFDELGWREDRKTEAAVGGEVCPVPRDETHGSSGESDLDERVVILVGSGSGRGTEATEIPDR
jgi:hypothetical protein